VKIFDLMAFIIEQIHKAPISDTDIIREFGQVQNSYKLSPKYTMASVHLHALKIELECTHTANMKSNHITSILPLVEQMCIDADYTSLVWVLQSLDDILPILDIEDYFEDPIEDSNIIISLNSNCTDIILLPNVSVYSPFHTSIEKLQYSINGLLRKIKVIFTEDLGDHPFKAYYLKTKTFKRNPFIVAGSAVSNKYGLHATYNSHDNKRLMSPVTTLLDVKVFENQLLHILDFADKSECAVLAMPELAFTKEFNDHFVEELKSLNFMSLRIIALPTYYDFQSHKNVGAVYSTEHKRVLFSQEKTFPFDSADYTISLDKPSKAFSEWLTPPSEINLLCTHGVGGIIFPICKDILMEEYRNLCKALYTKVAIIRAFSCSSPNQFMAALGGLDAIHCSSFCINGCGGINFDNSADEYKYPERFVCLRRNLDFSLVKDLKPVFCPKECDTCLHYFTANTYKDRNKLIWGYSNDEYEHETTPDVQHHYTSALRT